MEFDGLRTFGGGAAEEGGVDVVLKCGLEDGHVRIAGAAVGLELRYDRFDIGVSRSFVNSALEGDSEPFQISLGLNF